MFFLLICRRRRPMAELGVEVAERRARQHGDGLRTSARSRFRAGRWCSLSIGAWLPAPRRIMAAQCAEPPDVLFADLPAAPADGRATGSRSPSAARASMMMAFGRLLALRFRAGRWCSLSIGAWLPAPRRIMAAQCAEPPDVLFADLPAAPADGRATGSRSPSAARASMMMAFGRLLALNSGLGVGALYPLARGCRRRAGSWPLSAPSRRMFFLLICRRRRPMAELRGRGRRAPRAPA